MSIAAGAGAAANVVGGVIQAIAANQAAQAMGTAYEREQVHQNRFRNQAYGTLQTALPLRGSEEANRAIAEGSQNRQALYQNVNQTPLALQGGPSSMDRANFALQGKLRGNLGGYSDWAIDQMVKNIRTQDELNKITNFAGGQASTFPYRMYDAQHSQDELAFLGTLISSLGGGAQNYAQLFGTNSVPQQQFGGQGGAAMWEQFAPATS